MLLRCCYLLSSGSRSSRPSRRSSWVGAVFERYGEMVGLFPLPFLLFPVLASIALATGTLFAFVKDDIRFLYSPSNSPSRQEYRVHQEFSGEDRTSTFLALALVATDGYKNLLTAQRTRTIGDINKYVLRNLSFDLHGQRYNFGEDICPRLAFCPDSNKILEKFLIVYQNSSSIGTGSLVDLQYPIMRIADNKFFLPGTLYGVDTDKGTGKIRSADMIHMTYPIPATELFSAEDVAGAFEEALSRYLAEVTSAAGMRMSVFSIAILKHELAKNTFYTLPYISLTAVLLVGFTVASCCTKDPLTSKPLEALLGVTSSALAIVSAGGLMFYAGVPFITQVSVMPFIALAIGIDDAFIIIAAWQRTPKKLEPHVRLGLALREAGSAITVTSLTDCLSFGIGSLSPTPAIAIFCKYTATAIAFDFVYQLTFFAAVMGLGGVREARGRHCLAFWRPLDPKVVRAVQDRPFTCSAQRFFGTHFARLVNSQLFRVTVLVLYAGYVLLSLVGIAALEANLVPSKLLVDDSPLKTYISLAETHMWSEGLMARVYVDKAPDFREPGAIARFMSFVTELEQTPFSIGSNSTSLWLREFLDYQSFFPQQPAEFYRDLGTFLSLKLNSQWGNFLRWDEGGSAVERFYFTTGFRVANWRNRTTLLLGWRAVAGRFPDYGAVVYDENNFYSDQVLSLPDTALQAMGIALFFMSLICFAFIEDAYLVFWVLLSLLSMDMGIIGLLSLWGSDLSPTTILNILMSIGLSVDFATHVAYRFHRVSGSLSLEARMAETLGSIAWPVLQGGVSTFLAVFSLQFVASFVVRIFFRTIFLVVTLGLFHGLILLPVLMRSFAPPAYQRQRARERHPRKSFAMSLRPPQKARPSQLGSDELHWPTSSSVAHSQSSRQRVATRLSPPVPLSPAASLPSPSSTIHPADPAPPRRADERW